MNILFIVHSLLRWVIVVVALLAILKFALGLITRASFKGMDRGLAAGYSGLMDLQMTIGLIYFIWDGAVNTGFPTYRILHMVIMIAAAVVAHLPARFKGLPDQRRFQYSLLAVIGSVALIFAGISVLQ